MSFFNKLRWLSQIQQWLFLKYCLLKGVSRKKYLEFLHSLGANYYVFVRIWRLFCVFSFDFCVIFVEGWTKGATRGDKISCPNSNELEWALGRSHVRVLCFDP